VVYISIFEECLVVVLSGWQSNWFCCFLCEIVKKSEGVGRKGSRNFSNRLLNHNAFLAKSCHSRASVVSSAKRGCKIYYNRDNLHIKISFFITHRQVVCFVRRNMSGVLVQSYLGVYMLV